LRRVYRQAAALPGTLRGDRPAAGQGVAAGAMSSPPPASILIVDDEIQNRRLLEALLKPEGYVTRSVAGGTEALAAIAERAPDLILLDVMMPGMDGYAIAR